MTSFKQYIFDILLIIKVTIRKIISKIINIIWRKNSINEEEIIEDKNNSEENMHKELVKIKEIETEIGPIFILQIGDINIRPYLSREEAEKVAEFMERVEIEIIRKCCHDYTNLHSEPIL